MSRNAPSQLRILSRNATFHIDHLDRDPNPVSRLANATLDDIAYVKFLPDFLYGNMLSFVGEHGGARDHMKARQAGQQGGDILAQAIGQKFDLRIRRQA